MCYNQLMDEKIEQRFNQLEKRISDGFLHVDTLIENLAAICGRQFESIDKHFDEIDKRFEKVDERLESIDDKIETFAHRMDHEVEERHQLAERVTKLESLS